MKILKPTSNEYRVEISGQEVCHVYFGKNKDEILNDILHDTKSLTRSYLHAFDEFDEVMISYTLKELAILRAAYMEIIETPFE